MLATLSKPKTQRTRKDKNQEYYVHLSTIPQSSYYVELNEKFYGINRNIHDIQNKIKYQIFNHYENKKEKFQSRVSDGNISLPEPVEFNGGIYEPLLVKIWLPVIESGLEFLLKSDEFRKITIGSCHFPKSSDIHQNIVRKIIEYNRTRMNKINEEKQMDYNERLASGFI